MHQCLLCAADSAQLFFASEARNFFKCDNCQLIFADPATFLDSEAEYARYLKHENDPTDLRYQKFYDRLLKPLLTELGAEPKVGLDFGSGPGPTLSILLEQAGHSVALYDPFFAPDRSVLERSYDFVTCTETMEHFYAPGKEWQLLSSLLAPGGVLAVMTRMAPELSDFKAWTYKNDPTHVCFYSPTTFNYLAQLSGFSLKQVAFDAFLFGAKRLL